MVWLAFFSGPSTQLELGAMQLGVVSNSRNLQLGGLFQRLNNINGIKPKKNQNAPNGFSRKPLVIVRAAEKSGDLSGSSVEATKDKKWLKLLPDKKSALYSHSLPCIEAWLRSIGFSQAAQQRASWVIQRPDWHAQLSLEITELRIRYLKSGPGNLERDVERKFSYALCREDLENAILGGP